MVNPALSLAPVPSAVVAGTVFSAISGSTVATTALLGSVLLPQMLARGYHPHMGVGPIMAIGGVDALIPPSAITVLFGSLASISVSGLLLGGVPEGGRLWPIFEAADLGRIDWAALLPQLPQLATIPLVATLSSLLMVSGIEAALRRDMNVPHEMTVNGIANVAGALAPANAAYTSFSF